MRNSSSTNASLSNILQEHTTFEKPVDLKRLQFIVREIEAQLGGTTGKILEIGCGNGNICAGIASQGHQVMGVDIDKESIERARQNFQKPNLEFKAVAAENISEEEYFDVIVCSEVLEHLEEPGVVVDYAYRQLPAHSLFIVTVPNGFGPREVLMTKPMQYLERVNLGGLLFRIKRLFGFGQGTVQSSNPDLTHLQFFSKKAVIGLHEHRGFQLQNFRKLDGIASVFPFSMLFNRSFALQRMDLSLADLLPYPLSSGFAMSFLKDKK